jgi:hypothetical protein
MKRNRQEGMESTGKESSTGVPEVVTVVELRVPLAEPLSDGYQSQMRVIGTIHIDNLTQKQRRGLQWLYGGLRRANVEFENRKPVASQHDAIRYVLDLCGDHAISKSTQL